MHRLPRRRGRRAAALADDRVVAIGELGLDLFRDKNLDEQLEVLGPQLDLAVELDLPVIIHCRDAAEPMLEFRVALRAEVRRRRAQEQHDVLLVRLVGPGHAAGELLRREDPAEFHLLPRLLELRQAVPRAHLEALDENRQVREDRRRQRRVLQHSSVRSRLGCGHRTRVRGAVQDGRSPQSQLVARRAGRAV